MIVCKCMGDTRLTVYLRCISTFPSVYHIRNQKRLQEMTLSYEEPCKDLPSGKTHTNFDISNYNLVPASQPDYQSSTFAESEFRRFLNHKIWFAICKQDWNTWNSLFSKFQENNLPFDEVSYTLRLHGYLLSHRYPSEQAFLVLEEMEEAAMHPIIIRLNRGLLYSYFELKEIFCEPPRQAWQNICRMVWQTSVSLLRERKRKIRNYIESLSPNEALKMDGKAIRKLMLEDRMKCISGHVNHVGMLSGLTEIPYVYALNANNASCSDNVYCHASLDEYARLPQGDHIYTEDVCSDTGSVVNNEETSFNTKCTSYLDVSNRIFEECVEELVAELPEN